MDGPFCISDLTPVDDRVEELDRLANAGMQDPALKALAAQVRATAQQRCQAAAQAAQSDPEFAQALRTQDGCARIFALEALRAAQSAHYSPERSGKDCYQGVGWTLSHGGECKALTVLFVALARTLGLKACPIWLTQTGAPLNHVLGLVWVNGKPLWADPSIRGAMLGESPYEAVPRLGAHSVIGIKPAGLRGGASRGGVGGARGGFGGGARGGFGGGARGGPVGGMGRFGGGFRPMGGGIGARHGFRGRGFRHTRFFGSGGGWPFGWWGWDGLWGGWPSWWWCYYYPYLCQDVPNIGFYSIPYHEPVSPAGCACIKYPVKNWGVENTVTGPAPVSSAPAPVSSAPAPVTSAPAAMAHPRAAQGRHPETNTQRVIEDLYRAYRSA